MSLQALANNRGILLSPAPMFAFTTTTGNMTIDAAGESVAIVGYINLSSGPGTSKTLSAAGSGKILWWAGTTTFNNASTNLRIGVHDVAATGLEDGTYDVRADLVGGTDTITANAVNAATMETGSKTITHGDLIAIVLEFTARGGADSMVVVRSSTNGVVVPYATADTGSGPAKGTFGAPFAMIQFDDGTVGWMDNHPAAALASISPFGSSSTPDEYALVFQVPFKAAALGLSAWLSSLASTDDFELILYSDPLGTPVAERTLTQDMDLGDPAGQIFTRPFTSAYTLQPNTDYAIALRPTTTNSLGFFRYSLGAGNGNSRNATPLGTNWSQYTRSDNTGAFGSQDTTFLPLFGVWLQSLSDDRGIRARFQLGI
jgi:hypothetical protein